jgi:hypothetical protein
MTDAWKIRVENATVRLSDLGGLGVLVPGGFIATATHCIHSVGLPRRCFWARFAQAT